MRTPQSLTGIDLCKALSIALEVGCRLHCPRRTGEVVVLAPDNSWRVRMSKRRKSSPRALTVQLARLCRIDSRGEVSRR
jgi:hypothetical protein